MITICTLYTKSSSLSFLVTCACIVYVHASLILHFLLANTGSFGVGESSRRAVAAHVTIQLLQLKHGRLTNTLRIFSVASNFSFSWRADWTEMFTSLCFFALIMLLCQCKLLRIKRNWLLVPPTTIHAEKRKCTGNSNLYIVVFCRHTNYYLTTINKSFYLSCNRR